MKALDIVKTPHGGIAFITETKNGGKKAALKFINGLKHKDDYNAWWYESELTVLDSIPRLLADATCHPFGLGKDDVKKFF